MRFNPFRRAIGAEPERAETEERSFDPSIPPTWADMSGGYISASVPVNLTTAFGLPAVGAAIRLLSETVAQLPLNVYRGRGADKRLADQTWQYRLLAELPGMGDFTPYDLLSDVVASIEAGGNAYLQKVKAAGQVLALIVIDPSRVRVTREDGEKVFYVRDRDGVEKRYDAGSIIHIRGFTLSGADLGLSPIAVHRQSLGSILAQEEFKGRYYGQGTHVGGVITTQSALNKEQSKAIRDQVERQHGSVHNAHLPLVLQGGMDWKPSGMSLQDSQYVEGERLNLTQVANIFRIPPRLLGAESEGRSLAEQDMLRFYTLSLGPRLRRIELALASDADLFPQRIIYPEFDTRPLLRTDAATQAEVDHKEIQSGLMLVDEIRAERGMAPLPDGAGQVPQQTPVGGAPNPDQQPPDAPAQIPDASATV
jgi:HK97 family phage portal protein